VGPSLLISPPLGEVTVQLLTDVLSAPGPPRDYCFPSLDRTTCRFSFFVDSSLLAPRIKLRCGLSFCNFGHQEVFSLPVASDFFPMGALGTFPDQQTGPPPVSCGLMIKPRSPPQDVYYGRCDGSRQVICYDCFCLCSPPDASLVSGVLPSASPPSCTPASPFNHLSLSVIETVLTGPCLSYHGIFCWPDLSFFCSSLLFAWFCLHPYGFPLRGLSRFLCR